MQPKRRLGVVTSETRAKLIQAATQIMREEGASAVTAGHLAKKIGLQRHIVHYYFGTIEDLFVAIVQRDSDHAREWLAQTLRSNDPLRVIWDVGSSAATLTLEFAALATRYAGVRAEFKRYSEEFRRSLTQALERHLQMKGITSIISPVAITIALQSIAYTLSIERLLDIDEGHESTEAALKTCIAAFLDKAPAATS